MARSSISQATLSQSRPCGSFLAPYEDDDYDDDNNDNDSHLIFSIFFCFQKRFKFCRIVIHERDVESFPSLQLLSEFFSHLDWLRLVKLPVHLVMITMMMTMIVNCQGPPQDRLACDNRLGSTQDIVQSV